MRALIAGFRYFESRLNMQEVFHEGRDKHTCDVVLSFGQAKEEARDLASLALEAICFRCPADCGRLATADVEGGRCCPRATVGDVEEANERSVGCAVGRGRRGTTAEQRLGSRQSRNKDGKEEGQSLQGWKVHGSRRG